MTIYIVAAFVLGFILTNILLADEPDSQIGTTIGWIWANLFQIIAAAVSGFVIKVLTKLAKKYGIDVSDKQEKQIVGYAKQAILYVEEWARKRVKLDKIQVKSEEKFNKAVKLLSEKVPFLTEDKIRKLIVSNLPVARAFLESKIK